MISKLVGVVWIDPADKQVMRLEARLAEGFKMAGGLLVNLRPGAAFVMEQTRMVEGIWLPRMAQINLSVKVLLFGGGDYNQTIEWSDYKHFSGDVGDYKLDAPKGSLTQQKLRSQNEKAVEFAAWLPSVRKGFALSGGPQRIEAIASDVYQRPSLMK